MLRWVFVLLSFLGCALLELRVFAVVYKLWLAEERFERKRVWSLCYGCDFCFVFPVFGEDAFAFVVAR